MEDRGALNRRTRVVLGARSGRVHSAQEMAMRFQRKTALINGGSSAIGLATARLFAAEGV
jgi:hypothetical protein